MGVQKWRAQYTRMVECGCGYYGIETYQPGRHLPFPRADFECTRCGKLTDRQLSDKECVDIVESVRR